MAAQAEPDTSVLRRFVEEALSDDARRVLELLSDGWQTTSDVADQLLDFAASKNVRRVQRKAVKGRLWFLASVGLAQTRLAPDGNPSAPDGAMVRHWRRTD